MNPQVARYLRLLLSAVLATVIASLVILVIALIYKWDTATQFSDGFFFAGAILVALGLLSLLGGFAQRADFKIIYSQSAGDASLAERTKQMVNDIRQGQGMLILLVGAGLLLILISILIGQFIS